MTPKVHLGTLVSGARTAGGKAAAATSRLLPATPSMSDVSFMNFLTQLLRVLVYNLAAEPKEAVLFRHFFSGRLRMDEITGSRRETSQFRC